MEEPRNPAWERLLLAASSVAICVIVLTIGSVAIVARNTGGDTTSSPFYALMGAVVFLGVLIEWARRGK
jgi:hypothetical protein